MPVARNFALALLRGYKRVVSPMLPASCRFVPTCSEYAMEAVDRYGALRGGAMAARRLLRCHPFHKGGYDPVAVAPASPAIAMMGGPASGGHDSLATTLLGDHDSEGHDSTTTALAGAPALTTTALAGGHDFSRAARTSLRTGALAPGAAVCAPPTCSRTKPNASTLHSFETLTHTRISLG